ncbi:hypothetical protein AAE478_005996 [Parahypoxylon ruwenzoriense]
MDDLNDEIVHVRARADIILQPSQFRFKCIEESLQREVQKEPTNREQELALKPKSVDSTVRPLQQIVKEGRQDDGHMDTTIHDASHAFDQVQIGGLQAGQEGMLQSDVGTTSSAVKNAVSSSSSSPNVQTLDALRAEARALESCTDDDIPRFALFRGLPPEIRNIIWDLAIPRRLLVIGSHTFRQESLPTIFTFSFYEGRLAPPSIAHVCRESRAVAFHGASVVTIKNPIALLPIRVIDKLRSWNYLGPLSWFDPNRDTVQFYLTGEEGPFLIGAMSDIIESARHSRLHKLDMRITDLARYRKSGRNRSGQARYKDNELWELVSAMWRRR